MSDIDDLLIEAKRVCGERWQKAPEYPWEVAARFGAEVGRLRVALQEIEVCSTCRMTVGFAKNINAGAEPTWFAERAKLEAENAELRAENDRLRQTCEYNEGDGDDAAELKRFRDREEDVRELVSLLGDPELELNCALRDEVAAVRDFKVTL